MRSTSSALHITTVTCSTRATATTPTAPGHHAWRGLALAMELELRRCVFIGLVVVESSNGEGYAGLCCPAAAVPWLGSDTIENGYMVLGQSRGRYQLCLCPGQGPRK